MTHVLRYLLIFGDRKKKVELSVSQEIENVKVETLKQKARELFSLKNVLLQIWDKGFEDWVDLDEGDPTPTNSRIKVEIDKGARSLADITIAQQMPSSVAVAKPALVVSTAKADPPVLQVLSSQSSYPPVALTTTGISLVPATPKSLPPLARLPPHSQSVSPKLSSGVPQRTLPVSQGQYLGEQSQGSQASSSVGKPVVVGEGIQDESDVKPRASHQLYPAAPCQPQDRPVLDYIQQSFSLPSRSPDGAFPPSQEDVPQRITTTHSQNKTTNEELQQSLPMELVQRSQIAERSVPLSHEGVSYRPVSSHLQDRPVIENMQHSFPVSSMQISRVPNRTIPPYQDDVHHQHMTTSPGQDSPEVQVVHESGSSMPFSKTSGIPGKALPPSHDLSLHRPFTTHSQNKQVGPFVQESYSLQPNIQNSETPLNKLPPSQGQVPPPIVIEDDPSPGKDHKDEQREDINCDPSLDHHDLSLSEYKLPEFPADIVRKLENGIILKARDVSVLLDKLYESVVPYTYYPSQSDYIYLTQRLLEQFPQLIHQAGLIKDCTYKWETWRQKLMHKFKNKRKRQDRDAPGVLHKRMNYTKHFGDLDERPSTTGQGQHGRGDLMGSDCPSDVDDEVFEVVDDVQDVVIKEEESMYHVMPADTTNLGDTPDVGVTEECSIPPPNSQTSRVPEGMSDPFQDPQTHQLNTSQQQDSHVMKCTQESLSVHPHRQSLRIPERSLPPLLNKASNRQINKHLGNKAMDVVQGSCSSKSHMQTSGFPERSMPQSQDHSQDKVPKLLLAMPHSQNQTVVEVEHQLGSSAICGQTSKSSLPPCQEQEERMTEVQHIKSAASRIPDKPSLYNYKLPEFPADIIQKLENGIPIEPKDRSSLLDTLYDSVVPYTYYPSAADYIYLINIFLERYPQLLPQAGPIQNCPDMWEAWRQKLMHKFKNKRKRQDRDAPAVREHTRKHLRSLEGLDELPSSDGQDLNERGYWIACDCPIEADDEIFEIVDDDQDVTFEEEHSKHVVAADTTNFGDLPDKAVARSVQESISSSPSIQSQGISERSFPLSQGIASDRTTSSCSQNKPVKDIAQDCTSGIPGKNLPFSQNNATYLLATSDSQNKPVLDSCHSQPYMQTSRIPEKTLPPSQAVPPATVVEENFSSGAGQSEKQPDVMHMESTASSIPHKPSLYDYKLPEFPSDIMRKLKHGIPIEPRDRSVLLDVLYESIVPYTYYPSSSDYTYFTQIFLEQFPQLLPQAGHIQYCSDNWEAWKQKLMHKFKNKRKRQDRHALAVREHTRKNFRYFQGLDELHGTGEQDLDERRDAENSSRPNEADDDDDDDIFEVVDVVEEVMIKKEESMYHVMPADTTNFGDTSEMS